jgi:hypothetical protein
VVSEDDAPFRNERSIERDISTQLSQKDITHKMQKPSIVGNQWQTVLAKQILPILKNAYQDNSNGGKTTVLGLSTRDSNNYDTTDITRPTFIHARAVMILNWLIRSILPDARYSTIVIHRGPGIPIHGQSYGKVYLLRMGDNDIEIGRMRTEKTDYRKLRRSDKFETINGTDELKYGSANMDAYTVMLLNPVTSSSSTYAERDVLSRLGF